MNGTWSNHIGKEVTKEGRKAVRKNNMDGGRE